MLGIVLAILGLGFLIFIHELGHYWMAKRVGMRVEVFSIGFGNPIFSWTRSNGEKWQVCWLPFGGYVKIKGTEREGGEDPYAVKDGFFGKTPWQRIKVAFMGPLVNLVFALFVFVLLFFLGGRDQSFSSLTSSVGIVDPQSPLYQEGVRPGDEVVQYGNTPVKGFKTHILAPMTAEGETAISLRLHNWENGTVEEKDVTLTPYQKETADGEKLETFGILAPASFLVFNPTHAKLPPKAPILSSGIEAGDIITWYDGSPVFSQPQLTSLVQDGKALVVIKREGEELFRRVPRVPIASLKLNSFSKEELRDWTYEADLHGAKDPLVFIPYNLTSDGTVEDRFRLIDKEDELKTFPEWLASDVERKLEPGDKIISVDGKPVTNAHEILKALQTREAHLIVYRDPTLKGPLSLAETEALFAKIHDGKEMAPLFAALSNSALPNKAPPFVLLKGITPKPLSEWSSEASTDPHLYLGFVGGDRLVQYNPGPIEQFKEAVSEIGTTLGGLIFGNINPKFISGPVGIVHIMSTSWSTGFKNALYWLAIISLNLGIINLLPLPVLDGGTIFLSGIEMVTKKPFSLRLIDKLVFPFALLLIGMILFFTYHDLARLFGGWVG